MKAIETIYKGYYFRSRLEARWAVFFDALELPFGYEPEGFDIGGLRYLPDFRMSLKVYVLNSDQHLYIDSYTLFFECKPSGIFLNERDRLKIGSFAKAYNYGIVACFSDPQTYNVN